MRVLNNFDELYEEFHTKQVHNTKTDSTKDYTAKLSHFKKKKFVYFVGIHDTYLKRLFAVFIKFHQ